MAPAPNRMNPMGWMLVGIMAVMAFPICWLPCVMPCSYTAYERPVYFTVQDAQTPVTAQDFEDKDDGD